MPNKCAVPHCRGNYRNRKYTKIVKFPKEPEERNRWIEAMPNLKSCLEKMKKIHVCSTHFNCKWKTVKGGRRPCEPPSVFPDIPKSCFKQSKPQRRSTFKSRSEIRNKNDQVIKKQRDKIEDFNDFENQVTKKFPLFQMITKEDFLNLYLLEETGRTVTTFISFQKEECNPFGVIRFVCAEKDGCEVPKTHLKDVCKNKGVLMTWTQFESLIEQVKCFEPSDNDRISKALDCLNELSDVDNIPAIQFIQEQLQLVMKQSNRRRYAKNVVIFAAELFAHSPSAYRFLRKSGTIILPKEEVVKDLLNGTCNESTLKELFDTLKSEQRFVNLLFDEVKLKESLIYTGGHIIGNADQNEGLASSALVIEMICHQGGPKYVLRVIPVAHLKADQQKQYLLEALDSIIRCGGTPVSLICDNCPLNQNTYKLLGGPGEVSLWPYPNNVFLTYDYVHVFKNIRNNWITEKSKELIFSHEGQEYTACWSDIVRLYEIDWKNYLRLTKLSHTAVHPKPLQRQSVPLVYKVFNEKTSCALQTLQGELKPSAGTFIFVKLISDWFTMMNIKDQFTQTRLKDRKRQPWTH